VQLSQHGPRREEHASQQLSEEQANDRAKLEQYGLFERGAQQEVEHGRQQRRDRCPEEILQFL